MVTLTIDKKTISVPEGTTILEAAKSANISIPTLCYLEGVNEIAACRIKDPSLHNWLALALAVRGEGISDFPICNKSFNLSYCGHDL